jgi:membrane associated rhomboid family serine protease
MAGLLIVCFLGQGLLEDARFQDWTLRPTVVLAGHPTGLFTSLFLHGGWAHVLMNAAFCLAFGAPVARLLGTDGRGAGLFLLFFVVCGAVAGVVYTMLHVGSAAAFFGAAGSVGGLGAAAGRLYGRDGQLGPVLSPTAVGLGVTLTVGNLLVGMWLQFVSGVPPLGVEVPVIGFLAGLVLIGPVARLAKPRSSIDPLTQKDDPRWK